MTRTRSLCWSYAAIAGSALTWHSWASAQAPSAPSPAVAPARIEAGPAAEGQTRASSPVPESPSALPPAPLADLLRGQAKADYDAGRLLSDSGDYAGALLKFQSAYQAAGDPRLLWNAAACERNLRHYARAIVLVRSFLSSNSALITPEAAGRARAFLDAAEPLTARLQVESNVPTSLVFLDDERLGAPSLASSTRIDLGTHRVVVEAPGFERYTETLTVTSSAVVQIKAVLRHMAVPMPVAPIAPRDDRSKAAHSSPWRSWLWSAGGAAVLAGVVTASYFIFKPSAAPDPVPGSIATYRF